MKITTQLRHFAATSILRLQNVCFYNEYITEMFCCNDRLVKKYLLCIDLCINIYIMQVYTNKTLSYIRPYLIHISIKVLIIIYMQQVYFCPLNFTSDIILTLWKYVLIWNWVPSPIARCKTHHYLTINNCFILFLS